MAIIGAGPIGLEAAVAAAHGGFDFAVYEAGDVASHVRRWGHVTLFTPFSMNHSDAGASLVRECDAAPALPDPGALLTGAEFARRYLIPLAQSAPLREHIRPRHRVVSIGRTGHLKGEAIGRPERGLRPFRLLIDCADGVEILVEADVVIDATGTYGHPNWLGQGGIPAMGERALRDRAFDGSVGANGPTSGHARARYGKSPISYMLDDINGLHRRRYAGKHTVLVGAGYSAATSIVAFAELIDAAPDTRVTWLTRGDRPGPVREIPDDCLPARRALARRANRIAVEGHAGVRHEHDTVVERVTAIDRGRVRIESRGGDGGAIVIEADCMLANVGYRPDRSLYAELQVHECYATMAPMKLAAALLAESAADCLDRKPSATDTLINPEPNFFILGAKSYGRDATFLMRTGIAQVAQVFDRLACPVDAE